jgi:phage shock protein PspC (stress-responsive transcriptional regulator)
MPVVHCSGRIYNHTEKPEPQRVEGLRRPIDERVLAGVATAIARYISIDVTAVRIAFVVLAVLGGAAVPLYAAGWLLIPAEGAELSIGQELVKTFHRH